MTKGRVLIIAGSDPSGGAGLQADIKTVTALGGYAMTAVTALTVQNTRGVTAVQPVSPDFICKQIDACLEDIGADAIKIGMIGAADAARAIAQHLKGKALRVPIILDPVLVATSGDALAEEGVARVILDDFLPDLATVLTPNIPELEALTGHSAIESVDDMKQVGADLQAIAPRTAFLLKGGHLPGDEVSDLLIDGDKTRLFVRKRIDTTSTHGTGCTLASALATGLAQGLHLEAAAARAIDFVDAAIRAAPGFGAGCGPLGHAAAFDQNWRPVD